MHTTEINMTITVNRLWLTEKEVLIIFDSTPYETPYDSDEDESSDTEADENDLIRKWTLFRPEITPMDVPLYKKDKTGADFIATCLV